MNKNKSKYIQSEIHIIVMDDMDVIATSILPDKNENPLNPKTPGLILFDLSQ